MARGRKRIVEATSDTIRESIANIDVAIAAKTDEIKSLKTQKKELLKDLAAAEKKEALEKEEADMKSLVALMKEKNITTEDIEKLLLSTSKIDGVDAK